MCSTIKSPAEFKSLISLLQYFKDEKTCLSYIEQTYWEGSPYCPHCACKKVYRFTDGVKFRCSDCKKVFTLKKGTIFENSNVPLVKWFMAIYFLSINTGGCSCRELAKHLEVRHATAWFMMHRIRNSFKQDKTKLEGVVQVDECFCGGANSNRHIDKKVKNRKDRTFKDKHTVVGFVGEDRVICEVIPSTQIVDLIPCVFRRIKEGSIVVTDEWPAYKRLNNAYVHSIVSHHERKFISAEGGTTNRVENLWSHLKRMFYGTYNWVSKKHIQRYIDEFTFRFNQREQNASTKFAEVISNIKGWLPYKTLVHG